MEDRRWQKQDNNNNRRSRNKRPPRGNNWHRNVPKWEKEFCKVVGSLDWETLLQMKKFMHIYDNVINWDDSAGKEAFHNAKKRFWAEINGLYCHLPLPDPDLYIDKINWDSEIDTDSLSDVENEINSHGKHEPVVIFGDSLLPYQGYSLAGWGDDEANFKVPENNNNILYDNRAVFGSSDYSNHAWGFEDGWNDGWNWNYANNDSNVMYEMGPNTEREMAYGEMGPWSNVADMTIEEQHNAREWNSFNSCGPVNHHAAITVGQTWNP